MLKTLLFLLLALLPSRIKRAIYNQCLGCAIHPTACIGLSFVRCGTIVMGPDATIKHFNIIRGLALLDMGEKAKMGNWNTLTALPLVLLCQILSAQSALNCSVVTHHTTA